MSQDIEEIITKLRVGERQAKLLAIKQIQQFCHNKSKDTDDVYAMFEAVYLFVFKCYTDRFESVRNGAIDTINICTNCLPLHDIYLARVLATLVDRLGSAETKEESEEIRLKLVQQLHLFIKLFTEQNRQEALQANYEDITRILCRSARDEYPEVQAEVCACIKLCARYANTQFFSSHAEKLATSLYALLSHKHSSIRISAIAALAQLALHVDASGDKLKTLIMNVSPKLMDDMPLVRRECGEMGTLLLLDLRDRYSYFEFLIPLVLCCLKDECVEIIDYIRPMWERCGVQYYNENELELNKQDISDGQPKNYPKGLKRPSIGCRALVQRSLRLLPLITRESTDWKDNVRLHSMKLLYQFVLHAEAAMTAKFFEIYPDLARSCCDSDPLVIAEALKVADLMGHVLNYADWSEHGFDGLSRTNKQEGYLKCFYHMYVAATDAPLTDDVRITNILLQSDYSNSFKLQIQVYVVNMIECLVNKNFNSTEAAEPDDLVERLNSVSLNNKQELLDELVENFYVIIMKIAALCWDSNNTQQMSLVERCDKLITKLAASQKIEVDDLHDNYLNIALDHVVNLDAMLEDNTEPIILLHGLICYGKFRVSSLPKLKEKVLLVWKHCCVDAHVKICFAISLAMLDWKHTIKAPLEERIELLRNLLSELIIEHIQWKVGLSAESMRAMAVATLAAVTSGATEEAQHLLPEMIAEHMPRLLEDRTVRVRQYAVKCLLNFGAIPMQHMKSIAYAVLQRLDDPSQNIREAAIQALTQLEPKFSLDEEECAGEHQSWEAFIRKACDLLFLHYESPDLNIKQAIRKTILNFATKYETICAASYKHSMSQALMNAALKELGKELPFSV